MRRNPSVDRYLAPQPEVRELHSSSAESAEALLSLGAGTCHFEPGGARRAVGTGEPSDTARRCSALHLPTSAHFAIRYQDHDLVARPLVPAKVIFSSRLNILQAGIKTGDGLFPGIFAIISRGGLDRSCHGHAGLDWVHHRGHRRCSVVERQADHHRRQRRADHYRCQRPRTPYFEVGACFRLRRPNVGTLGGIAVKPSHGTTWRFHPSLKAFMLHCRVGTGHASVSSESVPQ